MANTWTIKVDERTYGPYTLDQMRAYVGEGRLAAHSIVARNGSTALGKACDDPDLGTLFQPAASSKPFFASGSERPAFGRHDQEPTNERSHYIIIADMKSRSVTSLEEEIFSCGPAFAIVPQAWLVCSELSINAIRNKLVQKLGRLDVLFIADATHDKAAWFNYGPEKDSRIRVLWQKAQDQLSAAGG